MTASYADAAAEAARIGGRVLLRRLGRIEASMVAEKALHDLVTEADRESEREILAYLRGRFPGHDVLAEESAGAAAEAPAPAGYRWVVDPLDGTTNFLHGYPCFCVSVALERDGRPVAGCVHDPVRGETFGAEEGSGAWLDGRRIRVSATPELRRGLVATGFPARVLRYADDYFAVLRALVSGAQGVRRDGSAALDLASVACGRFDAFWEPGLSRWDLSAGVLLVREAGGKVTGSTGEDDALETGHVVASNGAVHDPLLELLAGRFARRAADSSGRK